MYSLSNKFIVCSYFSANVPIAGAVDFHSFGQLILRPWGEKLRYNLIFNTIIVKIGFEGTSKDEAVMAEIGDQLSNKIQQVNNMCT